MFLIDPSSQRLSIFTTDRTLVPQPGQSIVSLVNTENSQPQPMPEPEQAVIA